MDNQLIPLGDKQITPLGSLYIEKIADTLHRVKKYRVEFVGGITKDVTYQQYEAITAAITSKDAPKYIKFKSDGEVVATNQIKRIKPYEVIVDTRKENL